VGAAMAMRARMLTVPAGAEAVLDTCGTGGDGSGSVNVSTLASFIVAACGVPVAKHGNRALSSKAGSHDVIEALGLDPAPGPERAALCLKEAGLCFMFAPTYHAATKAVALCAKIELEISHLEGDDAKAFLADLGLTESGLDRVIQTSYDLLGYMSFFTVGEDECRAWSIARGTPAQLAAGEIHSDIQRGFIRAEVVGYDALTTRGSMAICREHGEVRLEGKEYTVEDGDIINFRFAT